MNSPSCTIITLSETHKCAGCEVSRECLILSEGNGSQYITFDPIFVLKLTAHSLYFVKNKFSLVTNQ